LILDTFVLEMSTYNNLLLHRLNWCYRGEIEKISWLQNVDGKLGKKLSQKPQFLQWNSQGIDPHKNECVEVGTLKMHDV
jgi:hypothetical protein